MARFVVAFGLLLAPIPAYAQYVDPGSASLLWQLALTGVFGVAFAMRRYLMVLVRLAVRRFRPTDDSNSPDA